MPERPKESFEDEQLVDGGKLHISGAVKYCGRTRVGDGKVLCVIPGMTDTCNLWRPRRTKHCKYCDVCVTRFDHHCMCKVLLVMFDCHLTGYVWLVQGKAVCERMAS